MIFPNIIQLCEEIVERRFRYCYNELRNKIGDYTDYIICVENQEGDVYFKKDNWEDEEDD